MTQLKEAINKLKTLNDVVRWAVSRFNEAGIFLGHGADDVWSEAISLVIPALHLNYDLPELAWRARLTTSEVHHLLELIMRRIQDRIPSAYLTHTARFAELDFYVDPRVLVPRSSIAELIEKRFEPWLYENSIKRILDMCTGSACIAIACAHYLKGSLIDAVDISKEALAVAKINIKRHHLESRVKLYQGNLFSPLKKKYKYDLIIANPPYVDTKDMSKLPSEYLHEPFLGLDGGKDGLEVVKKILYQAKDFLEPEGILIVEVGNSEAALMKQFPRVPFTWLEFERGDNAVFLLIYQNLVNLTNRFPLSRE